MKKGSLKKVAAGVMAAAMAVSCFGGGISAGAAETNGMVRSYLTGKLVPETVGRVRPISVMLNNIYDALPQSGIGNCPVCKRGR